MSDGPLRSLRMRRGWKRLAKRATNAAFDDAARSEALAGALQEDFRAEMPESVVRHLRHVLDDSQGDLFVESGTERLETLRDEAGGAPLAGTVLDFAAQALHEGHRGDEALETAVANAFLERAVGGQRQVEEHLLREASARSAKLVRNRIDDAIAQSNLNVIARRCLGSADASAARGPMRKTGIDDGVSLA